MATLLEHFLMTSTFGTSHCVFRELRSQHEHNQTLDNQAVR